MDEPKRDPTAAPAVGAAPTAATAQTTGADEPLRPQPYRNQERFVVVLLLLAIAAALVFVGIYFRKHARTLLPRFLHPIALQAGVMEMQVRMKIADPCGSPGARVKAIVIMEHCLEPVQDLLVQIGTAYPDLLQAEFHSMHMPAGQKVLAEHKENCAGVFINGKDRFQITEDGAPREAYLHGIPGSSYRLAHIVAIVKQEMLSAYGSVPADFDTRITFTEVSAPANPGGDAPATAAPGQSAP